MAKMLMFHIHSCNLNHILLPLLVEGVKRAEIVRQDPATNLTSVAQV
jgi:hypothetical protein